MAKEGYLRDGVVLFSSVGAFRGAQREETTDRLILRVDRINNEVCALPAHPKIVGTKEHIFLDLFGEEVDEICLKLTQLSALLRK